MRFNTRWENSITCKRDKKIMDFFLDEDPGRDTVFKKNQVISKDQKNDVCFGKDGEMNYAGVIQNLQMQTNLVILEFAWHRKNARRSTIFYVCIWCNFPAKSTILILYKETCFCYQ